MKVPVFTPSKSSLLEELPKKKLVIQYMLSYEDNSMKKRNMMDFAFATGIEYVMHLGNVQEYIGHKPDGSPIIREDEYYVVYFTDSTFRIVIGYLED